MMMIEKARTWLICSAPYCLASVLWFSACQQAAATDSRLPNGTNFVFWEQPLQFSKTYHVDCYSAQSDDNGPGTSERPFRTISKGSEEHTSELQSLRHLVCRLLLEQ